MSSFQNPWPDPGTPSFSESPLPVSSVPSENPVWSGWDVLQIALLSVVSIILLAIVSAFAAQRLFYRRTPFVEVLQFPLIVIVGEMLAYVLVLAFMVAVVKRVPGRHFWSELRWKWPRNWPLYMMFGFVLAIGLQFLAHFLPIPKDLPMDQFFRTAREAWVLSFFGMLVAPLMEELFFRGFLYPVLARRLGATVGILLTAASFGLIHAPQLGRAWGPVLVIFLVGLALTLVRAATKSVASSFLVHVAYNTTLSVALFVASDGFRHLERVS